MKKIIFVLCLCALVGACGRMSRPIAPEGTTYPAPYPAE